MPKGLEGPGTEEQEDADKDNTLALQDFESAHRLALDSLAVAVFELLILHTLNVKAEQRVHHDAVSSDTSSYTQYTKQVQQQEQ